MERAVLGASSGDFTMSVGEADGVCDQPIWAALGRGGKAPLFLLGGRFSAIVRTPRQHSSPLAHALRRVPVKGGRDDINPEGVAGSSNLAIITFYEWKHQAMNIWGCLLPIFPMMGRLSSPSVSARDKWGVE